MKTAFKFISLSAFALLVFSPLVRAADATPPPPPADAPPPHHRLKEMRERRMKHLDENLALTVEQKAQINAIWDKAEAEAKAMHEEAGAAAEERRGKRREAMKAIRAQVREVLTPEQQKKFDALPPERPGFGRGGDGEHKEN